MVIQRVVERLLRNPRSCELRVITGAVKLALTKLVVVKPVIRVGIVYFNKNLSFVSFNLNPKV